MTNQSATDGVHHIGLTIPDLEETRAFFTDTLNYEVVGELPDYPACFLSDGATMITLWQVADPDTAVAFDRKNVIGLHHLALKVIDQEALTNLHKVLASLEGVEIEFAPEPLMGGPTRHLMCSVPGGIRVEFIATSQ